MYNVCNMKHRSIMIKFSELDMMIVPILVLYLYYKSVC